MRLTQMQWLACSLLMFGIAGTAYTQGPGGGGFPGGSRGGKGSKGGGDFDRSGFLFMILAGKDKDGKPNEVIDVSKIEAPPFSPEPSAKIREKMQTFMKSKGISGTIMTKENFTLYNTEVLTPEREAKTKADTGNWAKSAFERMDTNKDGKLSKDELEASGKLFGRRSGILDRFADFDTDKDGYINMTEYTAYMQDRMGGGSKSKGPDPKATTATTTTSGGSKDDGGGYRTAPVVKVPEGSLDSRPTVFRYGKLPTKELPSWFVDLDQDKDGQIGLYEWRSAGKSIAEFKKYDTNGDGFITAEEMILVQRTEDAKTANALTYARINADPGSQGAPTTTASTSPAKGTGKGSDKTGKKGGWGDKGGDKSGKKSKRGWGG